MVVFVYFECGFEYGNGYYYEQGDGFNKIWCVVEDVVYDYVVEDKYGQCGQV